MHLEAFKVHAAKKEHYPPTGLSDAEAVAEFQRLSEESDAVVDYDGKNSKGEKVLMRVAVELRTVIINRNLQAHGQGYDLNDKAVKNADSSTVAAAYMKTHANLEEAAGTELLTTGEANKLLIKKDSTVGEVAKLGSLAALKADLDAQAMKGKDDDPDGHDTDGENDGEDGGERVGKAQPKATDPKIWMDRTIRIGEAWARLYSPYCFFQIAGPIYLFCGLLDGRNCV